MVRRSLDARCTRQRARALVVSLLAVSTLGLPASPADAAMPPETPELVAPLPGHVFDSTDPQVFTVRVMDPDGDRWVASIEATNLDTGIVVAFPTTPGVSGGFASGVAVPPLTPGLYRWSARAVDSTGAIGLWSAPSEFRVGTNRPPASPTLLVPADGAVLRRYANEPFSVSALDPDNDAFVGVVTIRDHTGAEVATFATSPSPNGGTSSGVLIQPLAEGAYTWSAHVVDSFGARSGVSAGRAFAVGPPPTAGGFTAAGTMTFDPPGVSPGSCEPSAATVALTAAAAVVNTTVAGYIGAASIGGRFISPCESALAGNGTATLDIDGTSTTKARVTCSGLTGIYSRVEGAIVLSLSGGCVVNGLSISRVDVDAALAFVPSDPRAGVTRRLEVALVGGEFVVRPE